MGAPAATEIEKPYLGHLDQPPRIDPILSLNALYDADSRLEKINAGIGVLVDDDGALWTPDAITRAAQRTPSYVLGGYIIPRGPIEWQGNPDFIEGSARIAFGPYAEDLLKEQKLAAIATVGGTHAVTIFAEAVKLTRLGYDALPSFVMGEPAYPNHPYLLGQRGIRIAYYPQLTKERRFNMEANIKAIREAPKGTVFLNHGAAHNPTAHNARSFEQWHAIAAEMKKYSHHAFFDLPYLGFDEGLWADARGVHVFMEHGIPTAVALSYSKTGALYNSRAGVLMIPSPSHNDALDTTRILNGLMRQDVSTPPAMPGEIMAKIFLDPELQQLWGENLAEAAAILKRRRELLAMALDEPLATSVREGVGIFSLLPLSPGAVTYLRKEHAIYIVANGRVNIGGVPTSLITAFANALKDTFERFPPQNQPPAS